VLLRSNFPAYFRAIVENRILLIENVYKNPVTSELAEDYSRPNGVISLMDVPLRICGELTGVMCFEKTGATERVFTINEQTFALSCALVFASTLEARQRRALQQLLNEELKQKDLFLKEVHHRVKNNLSVISSLINLQSGKVKDSYHKSLFEEHRSKIDSIALIHKLVYTSKHVNDINLAVYIREICNNLRQTYDHETKKIEINTNLFDLVLKLDIALPLGLIVNEVITNSFKHAFVNRDTGLITVEMKQTDNKLLLKISDNGVGFAPSRNVKNSMGMEILEGLVEQINGVHLFENAGGTRFTLEFPLARD